MLAKLTRQVRNPGYNLWDKYFIANICLYILCQRVLKLLQMNVKRKVSEQAVEGTEQKTKQCWEERCMGGEEDEQQTFSSALHTDYTCSLVDFTELLSYEKKGNKKETDRK